MISVSIMIPLFTCSSLDIKHPKCPGGSHRMQFSGILTVPPGRSGPHLWTRTSNPAEPRVMEIGNTKFPGVGGSPGAISGVTLISTSWFPSPCILSIQNKEVYRRSRESRSRWRDLRSQCRSGAYERSEERESTIGKSSDTSRIQTKPHPEQRGCAEDHRGSPEGSALGLQSITSKPELQLCIGTHASDS